ncbi:hypothetical protein H7H98_10115 [Mycolicibacterium sphagni]|nr:hypothetical protein [Mycolicibacterium sphagni]
MLLVAIGAFFPVYTTTASALAHVDDQLLEVGRAYGRYGTSVVLTVSLPAAAPELINGLRLGPAIVLLAVLGKLTDTVFGLFETGVARARATS